VVNLEVAFPKLSDTPYEITSMATSQYNCIAWAAGDDTRWWWPDSPEQFYWPEDVPRQPTVAAFAEAFRRLGYEISQDAGFETGVEKVAIFAHIDGRPTHAARQLDDGTWTSKLGGSVDIRHIDLDHVSGNQYGNPVLVLRRPRNDSTPVVNNSGS